MLHVPREMSSEVVQAIQSEMVSFFFFFFHVLFFTWFSFHNFAESITGTNRLIRVFDVLWFLF